MIKNANSVADFLKKNDYPDWFARFFQDTGNPQNAPKVSVAVGLLLADVLERMSKEQNEQIKKAQYTAFYAMLAAVASAFATIILAYNSFAG